MMELKAWNLARAECAFRVKRQVWSNLETPGRYLKGVQTERKVQNFPLPRPSPEEEMMLENTIKVRKYMNNLEVKLNPSLFIKAHKSNSIQRDCIFIKGRCAMIFSNPYIFATRWRKL